VLGLELLDVDLDPDRDGGRGHTNFAQPGAWFAPRPGALTPGEKDFVDRVLTTFMAGFAAESRWGHEDPEGSGYDRDQSARDWLRYLSADPRARDQLLASYLERAKELISRPECWRAVQAVADALRREGRLSGREATQIAAAALRAEPGAAG
jgi:hypothetical protein